MGTEKRRNVRWSASDCEWNDLKLFLSLFFYQSFEASHKYCQHGREVPSFLKDAIAKVASVLGSRFLASAATFAFCLSREGRSTHLSTALSFSVQALMTDFTAASTSSFVSVRSSARNAMVNKYDFLLAGICWPRY